MSDELRVPVHEQIPAPATYRPVELVRRLADRVRSLPRTVRRFAAVGVVNTAIDLALFAMLHHPLGVVVANFLSTSAGMVFSFLVNGRFTFGARRPTLRHAALFVGTTGTTMWALQPFLIDAWHSVFGLPVLLAKPAGLAVSVVANYLLYRFVVWPRVDVRNDPPPAGRDAAQAAARR